MLLEIERAILPTHKAAQETNEIETTATNKKFWIEGSVSQAAKRSGKKWVP